MHNIFHEKQYMLVFNTVDIVNLEKHIDPCVLLNDTAVIGTNKFVTNAGVKSWSIQIYSELLHKFLSVYFYMLCEAIM